MVLNRKGIAFLLIVAAVFLALRLPALHSPYHQDEYKWVQYSHPEITPPGTVPHPPLTELLYTKVGPLVGDDNFRSIPLFFGFVDLFLIFYLVRLLFDNKAAWWAVSLFAVSFYSVLASLMVDVDGAVMPFFMLLMIIGYYKVRSTNYSLKRENWKWLGLLVIGAIGGFMIKVSGILPLAAIALDFAVEKGVFNDKKRLSKYIGFGLLGVVGLVLILVLSKFIFPFFNLQYSLKYWEHFAVFKNRGWLQTFIQFAKSVMYLSPLLVVPTFFVDRNLWQKARPFFYFIFVGLFFYLFAFDFSLGALDRYLQFLVVPLCIVAAVFFSKAFSDEAEKVYWPDIIAVSVISAGVFAMQFFAQSVPPLYPKTEWLSRLVSFKWNFLFPFTGGSGPIPFYISFEFITLLWIVSIVFAGLALWNRQVVKRAAFAIVVFGLVYNVVFAEEYLFGRINGSAPKLVRESVVFLKNDPAIKRVVVYNDNGGWQVRELGKYERRMYATPQFENEYRQFLANFQGNILYINAPRVDQNSFYQKYFDSCRVLFSQQDKYISGQVLECLKKPQE